MEINSLCPFFQFLLQVLRKGVGSELIVYIVKCNHFKDGAYFCDCAYVLRISRYSGFLGVVPTNTGIFLRGLKLCGESRT